MDASISSYLGLFAVRAVLWLSGILLFNLLVDPYGVSPTGLSIPGVNQHKGQRLNIDRQLKPYEVWSLSPKTIILGTSRMQQSMDPAALDNSQFAPAYNAAVPAAELTECVSLVHYYFKVNPCIRHVFLEAFIYNFSRPQPPSPALSPFQIIQSAVSFHMSGDALRASFKTLFENATTYPRGPFINKGGCWMPAEMFTPSATFNAALNIDSILRMHGEGRPLALDSGALAALDAIEDLCHNNGAELHIILTPNYPWDDYRLYSLGYWPLVERWLAALAKHENVLSFCQYHNMSSEPVSPKMRWWNDPLHFNVFFGQKMLRAIVDPDASGLPPNFVKRVTPQNHAALCSERLKGLLKWAEENPEYPLKFEEKKKEFALKKQAEN